MEPTYLLMAICIEGAVSVVLLFAVAAGLIKLNRLLEEMIDVPK